jgi:hypothetical protein
MFSWLKKLWKGNPPVDFRNSQGILIRPDGSWVVASKPQAPPTATTNHPYAPPAPKVLAKPPRRDFFDESLLTDLTSPPDFFPQGAELFSKLEQCIQLDIISSCSHKQADGGVYILAIELPFSSNNTENMKRFKLFIKAMEEMYKFKVVQQERINSSTSTEQQYLVVFEYDPRLFILKKLNEDE